MIHFFSRATSCSPALKLWTVLCLPVAATWFWQQRRHVDVHHSLLVFYKVLCEQECCCERLHGNSCLLPLMDCCGRDQMTSFSTLSDDSCPDLGTYCSLQCPMGYERDDFGCEVCECSVPVPKCRPLSCTKTCPYGYVWVHPLICWVQLYVNFFIRVFESDLNTRVCQCCA